MFTFALNLIKKRSIIIIISDFIDQDYERSFRALAERHDVVAIQLTDPRESALPSWVLFRSTTKSGEKQPG